jgi:C4-dicarboxylate-specific signal transduction histidine kinase
MRKMSDEAKRAAEIIRRLKAFVRKGETSRSTALVNELVHEVVSLVGAELRSSGVVVKTFLTDDLPMLCCDSIQIQQVILNLISNALEAMGEMEKGVRLLKIRTALAGDDAVEINVSDNGPGLPVEAAGRVFEPFFTTKADGTGLGLSISRSIVEAHGGRLWATPNADKGVTFRIRLPLTAAGRQ